MLLISKLTGIFSSFAEKKISTDVKKQPPETSSCPKSRPEAPSVGVTVNVIANGSASSAPSANTARCGGGLLFCGGGGGGGRNLSSISCCCSNKPLA